ncbi:MAG: efflux RND transporter permease subunit, partial [Chloroflexota bacterium]
MGLTRAALNRPITTLMFILAVVIMGYRAFTLLQLDRFPKVDFPVVTVVTTFQGASPEDVEELIVQPIEDAVAGISGIDDLTSTSTEGSGTVLIAFNEGVSGNDAAIEVERQVSAIRGQLPAEADDPTIIKADFNAIPIVILSLSGPQDQNVLFELADNDLKTRLQAINGVASVSVAGGRDREVQISVDPDKLATFGLPLGTVEQALIANNLTFPAGSIEEGRQKISLRSVGEFADLDEIRNVVITLPGGGGDEEPEKTIYLRDIATVQMGLSDKDNILRFNGEDAVSVSVVKTSESNTVEVADEVQKALDEINEEIPAGATLVPIIDNSNFIRDSVAAVQGDLILAVIITGLVILVFLHNIRSTLIVVLSIPTAIISTFLVMWALGFSLNQLTLLALTLVIGILVDDSIVVMENIQRHIDMKKPPKQAALEGRSEIGLAAMTITLVDVVVYLPVAFTSGILGQFFFSYGVTIAAASLVSLSLAFTLTPMLAGILSQDKGKPVREPKRLGKVFYYIFLPITWVWGLFTKVWNAAFNVLGKVYAAILRFFLWNFATQILAVLIAVGALAGGVYMVTNGFVESEFFPQEDDGQIRIAVEMPAGTNLDATDKVVRQVEQIIVTQVPETVSILSNVGTGGGDDIIQGSRASNRATINVVLVDKANRDRDTLTVVDAMRPLFERIPEANISVSLTSGAGGPGSPVEVRVFGDDPNTLIDLANQV